MPSFCSNTVPRYLFRIRALGSAGSTTASEIIPPTLNSCKADYTEDIFRLKLKDAAALLNVYFWWKTEHEPYYNLISWTSSLLFALQYGLYRYFMDYDEPDLAQVFLLIIDTSQFPPQTFVKDMEIMDAINLCSQKYHPGQIRSLSKVLELRKSEYYFGEYLTQGRLDIKGACAETSVQRMIDAGLFELHPNLEDRHSWKLWAKRVVKLREPITKSQPSTFTARTEIRKAICIAHGCFGDRWAFPVAAMLLALKPRKKDDAVIIGGFEAMFTGKW